uniref:Dystrophin n=1 Tax=Globodera rostochiensis TaxID=31243 RepID=A0A914HK11_GLORO
MLFSGGGTKGTPPKEQRKERKPDRAEKYEIQEAVFVRWANSIIDDDVTVQELRDLTDVRFLSKFSTLILGVPVAIAGKSETDAIDAIFHAMLPDDPDDKLFQISVNELLSGQQKTLLGMCWRLIQIYWSKFAPSPSNERKLTEALKEWCLKTTASCPDVLINDFTSSFRDGMAINILIKSFDESLIDLREISELRGEDRIENALSLARREHLDMKSVACYLMMLYLGMCEKTGTQQRDPNCAIRRRSTITAPPPAAVVYASASADQQQQPHHSPTSSIARPSLVHQRSLSNQQVMPSVPIIVHPQQQQVPSQFPTQTTPTPVLQPSSTLLSPPAVTQSFKAVAKMASLPVTTTTTAISPLAKQSHNQTQLFQHHVIQQMQQQHPQQFHVQVDPNDLHTAQHQPQQFAQVVMQREPTQIMQPLIWPQIPQHAQAVQPTGLNLQQQQQTVTHQTTVQPSADQPQSFEQQSLLIPPTLQGAVQAPIPSPSNPQHSMPSYEASIVPPLPTLPSQHSASGDASIEGFRSRKSSSSSRSRSRKLRKPEEMIQEYGNCFQQVLNWLNEAEHDLDTMKKRAEMDEDITSLEIAKEKFREHELYMQSLTQSQESVGRVLHRGHQLSQRLEGEKAALIFSELEANDIDSIQRRHLKDILAWLDHAETTSKDQEVVADGVEGCRTQRSELIELKRRMKEKQQSIERLSTFVAVVDQITQQQPETVGTEGIVAKSEQTTTTTLQMETVVKQVIKRWEKLNEWVEQREKVLDEIEKLLEQYEQNSEELSRWLDNQLDELQNLQTSEDQLEGGEEVQERLDELSQLGKTLEAQQEALVRLSQVCTELAAKFEKGANAEASAKVRHRLDKVTHKWDQIVAGLEEHSEKLIRSGKVRLGGPEDETAGNGQKRRERLQTIISMDESLEQQQISPQMKRRKQLQQSMEQFLVEVPEEMPPTSGEELGNAETPSTSAKCLEGEEGQSTAAESLSPTASSYTLSPPQQTVTNFLKKVAVVDQKIGPLVEWAANAEATSSSTSKGNVRQMVLMCQKKLDDMRELEPEMTKLQILLEHIHNRANLNAKQLHVVNEMFDIFMSRWSRVVATISKLLSALSKPEPLVPKKMSMQDKDKEGRVSKMVEQLSQWLIASAKYVDDLPPQCPPGEKLKKIAQIARQLSEQQTQLSQVKRLARFTEEEKSEMEVMEREMVELLGRIDQARKEAERCERALKMPTTTVQMRRDDSSPELAKFQPLQATSNISPPPLNEAESLRQKLLMEEAELANREEVEGREAEGNEWAQWLRKEESQLRLTEQCVPGDLNKLLEELEKCDKMIIELRKRLRDASTSESDPEMIGPFKQLLRTAETKRNHCMDSINKTQLAIHKAVKVEEVGDKFKRELDWLRRNSEETSPKDTEEKLRHLKEALNEQLGSKTEAVQLLDDLTQSVASAAGENAAVVKQMQLRMSKLDQQWLSISAEIEELLLCCAIERQKRADSWLTTKEEIVEELELAIRASFESATDAEELSEHLDNLERLLDRMNSLDEEAAEDGTFTLLTEQSGNISQILRTRGDALANAVQERCAQLRNAVTRCEHFEQKLCKMQGWCTLIHQILNQRFASDTSALEVPHEYKDAQRTGSLFKQVDKEFMEFDALVDELEQYIGQSKFEFASTERLRLQLNHANEQIEQLRSKYGEFKQPITLYEKMERIQKQLEEANSSMKDLKEEIQAENCEFFVLHARQIAVQLQDLGSECAACEVARDTLIREGILEEEQALNISTRLAQLNAKCVEELEPKALRAVHRFERAAELLQKLEREKAVMEKLAKEAENRVGEGKNHPLTITAMDELNRQVKAATDAAGKTKELEQLLKQLSIQLQKDIYESIAVTEQKCAQLKEQIDQWAEKTAEDGPVQIDEEKVLAEVAEMAQTLGESIGRVEAMLAEGQLDATFLEQQLNDIQPEKERYERKTLEMLDNTEYRKRVAPALADLTFRWQRLITRSREAKKTRKESKKSREPEESEKETERASPSPGKAEEAIRGSNFGLKVQTMIEVFEKAAQQLNFQKRPLSSLKEWEQRLSHSNQFVTTQKLRFDELIAEGKRLTESGPMELEVSAALAKLDKLIELVHQLDKQIESQEDRLFWTNKQLAKLDEQAELVRERMDTLERRTEQLDKTATDQTPIITIRYELMDTNGQLQLLQLSSDELRSNLPPSLCEEQIGSDVLEELNVQLKQIESRIQSALMFALQAQQEEVAEEEKSAEQRHESLAAEEGEESDGIEEGTLLALDAYGTEDEEGKRSERMGGAGERKELLESSVSTRMPMPRRPSAQLQRTKETGIGGPGDEDELQPKLDEQVDLNQFYVNMDIMEEFMEQPELLPYEGFDEKADILNDFETELERGQQLVMASQMTMEAQLAQRKVELEKRRETVQNLEELYTQCEGMLDELSQQCRTQQSPKRVKSPEGQQKKPPPRNESPDLDELEAMQTALENRVPPIAFRLQQIQNRLNAIAEYISTSARDRYQQRIQLFVDDFNEYAKLVKAKKRAMEERLADQTRITGQLEELEFWCDETEALVDYDEPIGALNMPKFEQHIEKVRERHESVDAKMNSFHNLDKLKDKFAALDSVEQQAKHEVRRSVAQLGKRISDLRMKLKERLDSLQEDKLSVEELWREFAAMEKWVDEAQRQLRAVEDAKIYKPSLANIERLASQISENRVVLQSINSRLSDENRIQNGSETMNGKEGTVEGENVERVGRLISSFETVTSAIDRLLELRVLTSEDSSATEEEIEQLYEQMDSTRQKLAKCQKKTPKMGLGDGAEHVPMIEYGTLSTEGEEEGDEAAEEQRQNGAGIAHSTRPPRRKMSLGEQTRLDTVTRLRSWLQEVERDVSATVDLSDQHLIRQTLGKMQNCVDEIQIHHLEIVRVLESAKDRLIIERAQLCTTEMERILGTCKKRKAELQHILEQCRIWEQFRSSIELWLTDANDRLSVGLRVAELSDSDLIEQLELCDKLVDELNNWKSKLQELNRVSNQLLDTHRRDNGHNLSHQSSKLNTQWTKFNDQLRIRRAVLEAAKRSRHDFQTALGHFQQWLNKMNMELRKLDKETDNPQRLKDTVRRREWLAQEKEARVEIDAHREIMESVRRMGRKLMEEQQRELSSSAGDDSPPLGVCRAGEQLKWRVDAVDGEWQALLELSRTVRERLESAQEECERLTQSLADFLSWTDQQFKTIAESKPIGNDLEAVQRQNEIVRTIERTIEARERQVDETIKLAHTFLMQHDLRPALHVPSLLDDDASDLLTPKNEVEREERRIGMQILADSGRLQTQWPLLKEQLGHWSENVTSALREMQELDRAMAEALLSIGAVEEGLNALKPVEQLRLEELKAARAECNEFRRRVHEAGTSVDDVNDWASNLQAVSIQLSERLDSQVQAVNARYERLKRDIGCRGAALERAFSDFGPSSEHFLVDLVEPPWQRAISTVNRLPYYIDHSSEQTQWDHPSMVDILEQLCSFNQVKFSAYRTAMKLRALQKRLCLDLIDLADLNVQYEKQLCNYTDEQRIQVEDVIQCLLPLFEKAQEERPALLSNVSLAVDLTLNLLLNIYDPCRDGKMRVLSFKVALVVLCHANLESKYTYLFHLISGPNGVDHKRLAILFYDLIHIPKFLGEAAAFGGSNIEPSVRSCFERVKFPPTINVEQFLEWLRKEPQSLVWLPVMHRLASSEFAKHQAKCNACKMFPVVGLRYRCLRCFNFDICQNCFFSQRTAKSHKLSHPMQEYCTPTSAGDDMRDFTVIIKNKVRQGKSRIGYLPVEQINEGPPLECNDQTPQNADTEAMHQRMQLIASRLDKRQIEAAEAFPSAIMPSEEQINGHLEKDNTPANEMAADHWALCKNAKEVDQASKEELGQLLQKLQYENIELKRAIDERRVALKAAGMPFPTGTKSTPNLCHQRPPMPGQLPNGTEMLGSAHPTSEMNGDGPRARTASSMPRSPPSPQNLTSAFPLQQQTVLPPPIQRHHFGGPADHPIPAASLHRQHSLVGGTSSTAFVASGSLPAVEGLSPAGQWQEMAVLAEAQHLRQHQKRLEERGMVLEDQNRQLQMQLERLQRLMEKKGATLQTQPEQLYPGFISSTEAEDTDMEMLALAMPMRDIKAIGISSGQLGTEIRRNRMDRLRETVDELNRAMENFVVFTQNCVQKEQQQQQDTDDNKSAVPQKVPRHSSRQGIREEFKRHEQQKMKQSSASAHALS